MLVLDNSEMIIIWYLIVGISIHIHSSAITVHHMQTPAMREYLKKKLTEELQHPAPIRFH